MIEAEALSRSYGDFVAVEDVSFAIRQGEIVGLLGHNGAGKSTIMKMLTGYLEPTAGRIRVDNRCMATQRQAIQHDIGYLPEICPLYPDMVVADYLEYRAALQGVPESARPGAIRRAVQRTALEEKALHPIRTLSRGYCQRVGVAQAILHAPNIIILDEPTNGLDPGQIQHMRNLMVELAQSATVILSTHILQEVKAVCERVLMIRRGRLALDASLAELAGGNSLHIAVDASQQHMQALLSGMAGIASVQPGRAVDGKHEYQLELDGTSDDTTAPTVATTVHEAGIKLYELRPETRDLETVFREANAASETTPEAAHA